MPVERSRPDPQNRVRQWGLPVLVIALGNEFLLGLSSVNYFRVTLDHGQQVIIER